jgi:hypothetical protein
MDKAFEIVDTTQSCADRETLQKSGLCGLGPAGLEAWSGPGTWGVVAYCALSNVASARACCQPRMDFDG